jgi:hypothetical protein
MSMLKKITQQEYEQEIRNFLGLKINKIYSFYDPNLFIGGLSLICLDSKKKNSNFILGIDGKMEYIVNDLKFSANTQFKKAKKSGLEFQNKIKLIEEFLIKNVQTISNLKFNSDSSTAIITFNDNSKLKVSSKNSKPLTYEDRKKEYSVFFGTKNSKEKSADFYKLIFK